LVGGATVRTSYGLDDLAAADTVVIPSVRDVAEPMSPDLRDAIRAADDRQARLVSICSGAFALAAAGVLDGRAATTHWIYVDLLREQYPGVDIDPAPLYVDNGRVLTSAGCGWNAATDRVITPKPNPVWPCRFSPAARPGLRRGKPLRRLCWNERYSA